MIRYLLDTSAAISLMEADTPVLAAASDHVAAGTVAISTCSVGELYYGVHASLHSDRERQAVEELLAALQIVEYDDIAAREYGRLRALMQRQGHIIPTMDTQIAAIAVAIGLTVVTSDKHFSYVPDLPVENWLES